MFFFTDNKIPVFLQNKTDNEMFNTLLFFATLKQKRFNTGGDSKI